VPEAYGGVCLLYPRIYAYKLIEARLGLTKTGQGARIEAIARGVPTLLVPGKYTLNVKNMLMDLRRVRRRVVGSRGARGFEIEREGEGEGKFVRGAKHSGVSQ
jgi:hypothetical protein